MNPVQLYKELPKTNCGECSIKTCMAFAVSVSKGDLTLDKCPHLDRDKVSSLSKVVQKVDIKEKIYLSLKEELGKIRISDLAESLGAEKVDGGIRIREIGVDYLVREGGEIEAEADEKIGLWSKILLLLYIKMAGSGPCETSWISFADLKGGVVKIEALKKECEAPLSELFNNNSHAAINIIKSLDGVEVKGQPSDHAWKIYLLPKIPILLLYWVGDDEFPSRIKLLFDKSADTFLDAESLVFLCEGFVKTIEIGLEAV